jgi:hypothetical protein
MRYSPNIMHVLLKFQPKKNPNQSKINYFSKSKEYIMQVNIKGIPYKNGKLDKLSLVKPQIHI